MEVIYALLTGIVAFGITAIWGHIDSELPFKPLLVAILSGVGAVVVYVGAILGHKWYVVAIFTAVSVLSAYADSQVHAAYTVPLLLLTVSMGVMYIVGGDFSWPVIVTAVVFLLFGFVGVYGRADGLYICAAALYLGVISDWAMAAFTVALSIYCMICVARFVVISISRRRQDKVYRILKKHKIPAIPALAIVVSLVGMLA